jgi:hypothetical protein
MLIGKLFYENIYFTICRMLQHDILREYHVDWEIAFLAFCLAPNTKQQQNSVDPYDSSSNNGDIFGAPQTNHRKGTTLFSTSP